MRLLVGLAALFLLAGLASAGSSCPDYCDPNKNVAHSGGFLNQNQACEYPNTQQCQYGCDQQNVGCSQCGDGQCDTKVGETDKNCYVDCHCGDGFCDLQFQEQVSCPQDCATPTPVPIPTAGVTPSPTPDNIPPAVEVSYSPTSPGPTDIILFTANASDPDDSIAQIDILVDSSVRNSCLAATCVAPAGPLTPGTHTYTARAVDSRGAATTLTLRLFTVRSFGPTPTPATTPGPGDADGDGIPNSSDQCRNTRLGLAVDGTGCHCQDHENTVHDPWLPSTVYLYSPPAGGGTPGGLPPFPCGGPSGTPCPPEPVGYLIPYADVCTSRNDLREYYCNYNDELVFETWSCPNGCSLGKCTCVDSDGGDNVWERGRIRLPARTSEANTTPSVDGQRQASLATIGSVGAFRDVSLFTLPIRHFLPTFGIGTYRPHIRTITYDEQTDSCARDDLREYFCGNISRREGFGSYSVSYTGREIRSVGPTLRTQRCTIGTRDIYDNCDFDPGRLAGEEDGGRCLCEDKETDEGPDPFRITQATGSSNVYDSCDAQGFLVEAYFAREGNNCIIRNRNMFCKCNTTSDPRCLQNCSNGFQDPGEVGIDCGGPCPVNCGPNCLAPYTSAAPNAFAPDLSRPEIYSVVNLMTLNDPIIATHASRALREWADNQSVPVSSLNTADKYIEAVAYYVDKHMEWHPDGPPWDPTTNSWCINNRTGYNYMPWGDYFMTANMTLRMTGGPPCNYCGKAFCGDCDDHMVLRHALLRKLGVHPACIWDVDGPGHAYNAVIYKGRYRTLDYGLISNYLDENPLWVPHQHAMVWNEAPFHSSAAVGYRVNATLLANYPGGPVCQSPWMFTNWELSACP